VESKLTFPAVVSRV